MLMARSLVKRINTINQISRRKGENKRNKVLKKYFETTDLHLGVLIITNTFKAAV